MLFSLCVGHLLLYIQLIRYFLLKSFFNQNEVLRYFYNIKMSSFKSSSNICLSADILIFSEMWLPYAYLIRLLYDSFICYLPSPTQIGTNALEAPANENQGKQGFS